MNRRVLMCVGLMSMAVLGVHLFLINFVLAESAMQLSTPPPAKVGESIKAVPQSLYQYCVPADTDRTIQIKAGQFYDVQLTIDGRCDSRGWSHDSKNFYGPLGWAPSGYAYNNEAVSPANPIGAAIMTVTTMADFNHGDLVGGWRVAYNPPLDVRPARQGVAPVTGYLRIALNDIVPYTGNAGSLLATVTIR
jgi:hypothetical protein